MCEPSRVSCLAQLVELPGEPYEPERTVYNCLEHYTVLGNTLQESKLRVKVLRVPSLYPSQRCILKLQAYLGYKWRLAQEHPHIAATSFCKAFEHAGGLPPATPFPTVLVMREYEANVLEYIDRFSPPVTQRTRWLLQTAKALQFLHDIGIVHGNLYTGNILIDEEGNALIADAMIYTAVIRHLVPDDVAKGLRFPNSLSFKTAQAMRDKTARWADPTVYDDVFAFAVVCWTVYSGKEPFPMHKETGRTVLSIAHQGHKDLENVPGMSSDFWTLLNIILSQDIPAPRWPSLKDLLSALETPEF